MVSSTGDDASIHSFIQTFFQKQLQPSELHPDAWNNHHPRSQGNSRANCPVAGDKYSYADLDDFSDLIARTVQGAPETSKVERRGVLPAGWSILNTRRPGLPRMGFNRRRLEAC